LRLFPSPSRASGALARHSRVSLRAQGVAVLVFPLAALFAALFAIYWADGFVRDAEHTIAQVNDIRGEIILLQSSLLETETLARGYVASGQSQLRESFKRVRGSGERSLERLTPLADGDAEALEQIRAIQASAHQGLLLLDQGLANSGGAVSRIPVAHALIANAQARLTALSDYEARRLRQSQSERDSAHSRLLATVMACAVAGPFGALFIQLILARRLSRRIRAVEENARRLAHGLALAPVPTGNDEIASLAKEIEDAAVLLNARGRSLRENERRYRDLFNNAPIPYEETDSDGVVHHFNTAVCHLLKVTPDQILGCRAWDFVAPDQQESFHEAFLERMRSGIEIGPFECDYLLPDGSRITVEMRENLLRDHNGEVTGVCRSLLDVSERNLAAVAARKVEQYAMELRNKNEQLARALDAAHSATAAKSRFLASVSHELRTPLNSIIGFSEIMYDGRLGPIGEDHRECLSDILTSGRHLLQLINDVLDLSKVEAGKMEFHPEPCLLSKLVGEVRDVVRPLAEKKKLQLTTEVYPGLTANLDSARFKQILYNYLSNAVKFTPVGGSVVLRVQPEGDDAFLLEVEDTGVGIDASEIGRLFQEFQQLPQSRKAEQGTGLGLALTRRIVEAQGGKVGVRSTPGKGSVFSAVLPLRNGMAMAQTVSEKIG
jgi:PAS domain S-box-containing protein